MKYPKDQFQLLKDCLKVLKPMLEVEKLHPMRVHQIIYNQFNEGQKHNRLLVANNRLYRRYTLLTDGYLRENDIEGSNPLFNFEATFEMYPNDTNDANIITAVNKALKELR